MTGRPLTLCITYYKNSTYAPGDKAHAVNYQLHEGDMFDDINFITKHIPFDLGAHPNRLFESLTKYRFPITEIRERFKPFTCDYIITTFIKFTKDVA